MNSYTFDKTLGSLIQQPDFTSFSEVELEYPYSLFNTPANTPELYIKNYRGTVYKREHITSRGYPSTLIVPN